MNVAPMRRPQGSVIAGRAPRPRSPSVGCSTLMTSAPEPGQELRGERQRLHLLEGQHPHPVERAAVGEGAFVDHFAELHGTSVI